MNGAGRFDLPSFPNVRLIHSDPQFGGNGARQCGIDASSHSIVALLDDDDQWVPHKLATQLEAVRSAGLELNDDLWVVSSATLRTSNDGTKTLWPTKNPGSEIVDPEKYLFSRKLIRRQGESLQTSTFIFPKKLGVTVRFDPSIRIHQDWDWIIKTKRSACATILFVNEGLTYRKIDDQKSLSSQSKWRDSYSWGETALKATSRRVNGEFFYGPPLKYAIKTGQWKPILQCLTKGLTSGPPGVVTLLAGPLTAIYSQAHRKMRNMSSK